MKAAIYLFYLKFVEETLKKRSSKNWKYQKNAEDHKSENIGQVLFENHEYYHSKRQNMNQSNVVLWKYVMLDFACGSIDRGGK